MHSNDRQHLVVQVGTYTLGKKNGTENDVPGAALTSYCKW